MNTIFSTTSGTERTAFCHRSAIADPAVIAERLHSSSLQRRLSRLPFGLVLDMDDTLNSNQGLFDQSTEKLLDIYMSLSASSSAGRSASGREALSLAGSTLVQRPALRDIHAAVDHDLIATLGYTPLRWHTSAQRAAELSAGRALTTTESTRVRSAAEHAMGVGEILPGVERALSALCRAGVPMVLKTKGELAKQREKLAAHRFDRFFGSRIVIVERKDEASFRRVTAEHGLARAVSIGDSERSDIIPALAAGHQAIHIDRGDGAWSFERSSSAHDVRRAASMPHAVLSLAAGGRLATGC